MDLIIALEHRFWRTRDGSYWTGTIYPRPFWSRYLSVFDRINILARVYDVPAKRDSWSRVDGDGVTFAAVPGYIGPWALVRNFRKVSAAIRGAIRSDCAILLHVPGTVATMAFRRLQPGQPYGVEVLQDPDIYFSSDSFSHPLRPFWRWWFTHNQKMQCRQAACCLYVTERVLQQRYPPGGQGERSSWSLEPPAFSVGVSDVEMQDAAFIDWKDRARYRLEASNTDAKAHHDGRFRIIYVGTLERSVKAADILVTSFARSVSAGLDAELAMVGDGREKPRLEALAQSLGLGDRVAFLGYLSAGEAVRRQIDASDLFILPSRAEGMPRGLIEAMARGLPCIGSCVGGIPELLPEAALVQPGDIAGLAAKILQFARDPELRAEMGRQNLTTAHRYHESILQPKRIAFYEKLVDSTQQWQKSKK